MDHITKRYRVDERRVYLTGLSLGGHGSWRLAAEHPHRFAAVAPVCGEGNPDYAEQLKSLPIWAFHGAKDDTVPVERTKQMVEAVKSRGNKQVKATIYPDAEHDSWTETYNNPELYEWFLSHQKK